MTLARNILIFLGALIFSALLWAYVRLSSSYDADIDLPMKLTAPKGFALASGLPDRLHTRVHGAAWQILLMNFTKNAYFQLDLTERALSPEEMVTLHSDEITNAAVLPSEVHIQKVDPDSLTLQFGKAVERRITIVPSVEVQPAKGYTVVGEPVVSPRTVSVVAAESVLDSLPAIPTKDIIVTNAHEDVDRSVPITDSLDNFITVPNAPAVTVHVDIQAIGERNFASVPIFAEAVPPQFDLIFLPGTISVTLRGGVEELAKLQLNSIEAQVMYNPIQFDTAQTVIPHITVPKGITFLSSEPSSIKFILRKKELPVHSIPSNRKDAHAAH